MEPLDGVLDGVLEGLLLVGGDLVLDLVGGDGALEAVAVVLESVLGLDTVAVGVVLGLVLLGLGDHALDLVLGETALVVGDGDLLLLAGGLLDGGDVEDAVGVDVEGDVDLGLTAGHGGDAVKVEFAEEVVVAGHGALTLEDLDEDAGLVVGVGGESLGLLGGDGGVALDEGGHDTTGGLEAEGEGGDVEKEELGELLGLVGAGEDGGLDGGAVGDGLVGVDGLAGLLAVEEVGEHGLDLGDTGGSTDEDDLVDSALGDLGVAEDLLDGVHALLEVVHAQVLETGPGDGRVEFDAIEEGVDLDVGLGGGREGALGALAGGTETAEGALVLAHVLAVAALEVLEEVVDHAVVEVLAAEVGVSGGGLDLEDALLDGKEGDVEGTSAEVEDEDVLLVALLVEAVRDGGGGGLVDDTEDVEAGDGAGVLGGLTLGVVEVGGDGNDGVLDLLAEVGLGDLLHLAQDHGGDLLGLELLLLALVVDLYDGGAAGAGDDLEGPVLHVGLNSGVGELL